MVMIQGLALSDMQRAEMLLSERFLRGEADAFEQFVALHQPRVARLVSRLLGWRGDVEDVVQDVFLTAMTKAHTFAGRSTLWTWLTAITLNRCRSHLRRRALFDRFRLSVRASPEPHSPAADCAASDVELSRQVRQAVAALPAREREVVVLYYLEQRPIAEVSALLGISENAAHVRMHRGRQKLKSALAQYSKE
ncbi:MAG TPA: RNA polymerase sigma factor [Tepidisphaeraceae bacterium]|nr:RNA polymerase sigma factor [Tepidisphaeraceae bacterium]